MSRQLPAVLPATAMLLSPVFIALSTHLDPAKLAADDPATIVAEVAAHRPLYIFAVLLDLIGNALLGLAAFGVRQLIVGRGSTLVTIGWIAATTGGLTFAGSDLSYLTVLVGVTEPQQNREAAVALVDTLLTSPVTLIPSFFGWITGYAVSTLLIGIGVWRSRRGRAETIAGILLCLDTLSAVLLGPVAPMWVSVPLGESAMIIGYGILAAALLRTRRITNATAEPQLATSTH